MRTGIVVTTVAAAVASATIGALIVSSSTADARPGRGATTLSVVEHALTDTTADIRPHGDSRGDVLAFRNPIFNAANTKRIGIDNGSCVRTKVARAYECAWTTRVPGGTLAVQGPFLDTHDSMLAITGGTGRYVGASGQMRLHARNAKGTAYDFIFHLTN
jgi:hypothetical protein